MSGADVQLLHTVGDAVYFAFAGTTLFRYAYEPKIDAWETPKPYFHPLRTLSGELVTNHRA